MGASRRIIIVFITVFLASLAVAQKSEFNWDWRNQEVIGREDASIGNTSQLTEPERSSLIDAIVLRLQKPMGDAGYDDERIREIASTTRVRFIDVGGGQPLIFTTSIGLEGGCDALGNCPLWVFRRTDDGFVSLLNTIAASFTTQPSDAGLEVVFMHHVSAKQSGLAVYRMDDNKLEPVGCYTALWPKPSSDPTQLSDPKIEACQTPPLVQSARPEPEGVKPAVPASGEPGQAQPSAEQPAAQPGQEPAPAGAPAAEAPKTEQAPSSPEQNSPAAQQEQAQPAPAAPEQPAPHPKPDDAQPGQPPSSDQPEPDSKQEAPKGDQASPQPPAEQAAPDAQPNPPSADQAQQPQTSPDTSAPAQEEKPAQPAPDAQPQEAPKQPPSTQDTKPSDTQPSAPEPGQPQPSQSEPAPGAASPN